MIAKNNSEIPANAYECKMGDCELQFVNPAAYGGKGGDGNNVKLTLYNGDVVPHWFWGNLAFELDTMKLAKKRIPILSDHDAGVRLGFINKAEFDRKFTAFGRLLSNDDAKKIKADHAEGFPFESSLRFDPDKSRVEYVKDGDSRTVNGKKLQGPGAIVRGATVMEGSIVTFGALNKTTAEIFKGDKKTTAAPGQETFAGIPRDFDEIMESLSLSGTEKSVLKTYMMDDPIVFEDILKTVFTQAFEAGQRKGRHDERVNRKFTSPSPAKPKTVLPKAPPKYEFTGIDDGDKRTFAAAVHEFRVAGNSEGQALKLAARKYPKSHRVWIQQWKGSPYNRR